MASLRERLVALPTLVVAAAVGLALEVVFVLPLSRFIRERSTDIVVNFQLSLLFVLLIGLSSAAWLALLIRMIWGAEALWHRPRSTSGALELEEDVFAHAKLYKATTTKKALIFVGVVIVQLFFLDYVGQGALLRDTRLNMVLTGLRSPHGADRERVLDDAVLMGKHPLITTALGRVISSPGPARQWAAWAAGARRDTALSPQLLGLMKSSRDAQEVAASAMALSRLGDVALVDGVSEVLPRLTERRGDLIAAMGDLGKRGFEAAPKERATAVALLSEMAFAPTQEPVVRQIAIWALGRIEAAEVLPQLEALLVPATDTGTLCVASAAIANIGAADSSPKLLALCVAIGTEPACPQAVYTDYSGRETLLSEEKPVQVRLLTDVALIGDRRAIPELERLASSPGLHPRAQGVAKEIAYAMRIGRP